MGHSGCVWSKFVFCGGVRAALDWRTFWFDCVCVGDWGVHCQAPPELKILANFRRATICSSPINRKEFWGCGLMGAVIRSFPAYIAASCADTLGSLQWVGKNATVSQIHVPCVIGIKIW